ncbi:MAG: hypothetical protein FWC68_04650 [Oscillospiraceae bacterium]|nr:hypothetical protein [Oscillospiraceae bacterium]
MGRRPSLLSRIISLIIFAITIMAILVIFNIYRENDFSQFERAEYNQGVSRFTRDNSITTRSGNSSYRIESEDFNMAIFYREVAVRPNTPYRVTAMVKTENVISEDEQANAGAAISILNTTEISRGITGTNDWQEIEFMFNSRDRETVEIGFKLGGNRNGSKGTVWFSDFKLEEGTTNTSTEWNVACFIFTNIDANNTRIAMRNNDVRTIRENMTRFQRAASELSNNQMSVTYEVYVINEPITNLVYSDEFGNHVDPMNVIHLIESYLEGKEYDHIFVAVRMGDADRNIEIPTYDWIGLGRNGFIWCRFFSYKASE